jgi:prevent-host-death family protein
MYDVTITVAKAQRLFPELLGQVVYGKRRIITTKRGKPRARLFPRKLVSQLELKIGFTLSACFTQVTIKNGAAIALAASYY